MTKILVAMALAASLTGSANPPNSGTAFEGTVRVLCVTPATKLFDALRGRKWQEAPVWRGLASDKNMMQLWTAGSSWTITLQSTDLPDTACILWSGGANEFLKAIRGEQT